MRKGLKAFIITAVSLLLVVAIVIGIVWVVGRNTDPVKVVEAFNFVVNYYDNSVYYDGRVKADNLQSVYLSDTQSVTEILVSEGQEVKKGDPLLRYDTTLSDIQIERQDIQVKQTQLNLENARRDLAAINAMKPYSPPPATQPTEPSTEEPVIVEELPFFLRGKGTVKDPYRFLWSEELTYNEAFIRHYLGKADEAYFAFEVRQDNAINGALLTRWGLRVSVREEIFDPAAPTEPTPEETQESSEQPTESTGEPTPEPEPGPTESTEPPAPTEPLELNYAFFVPLDAPADEEDPEEGEENGGETDDSSGFTAAEIAQMREEAQQRIRDLDLEYRMAQVELERMQAEASGGTLYSKVDGTVTRLVDEDTARMEGSALLTVSGGGCYYVNIAIGEFERETLPLGTTVSIESWWGNYTTAEGTIESISATPVNGYYNGNGNPNVTLYNAVVAVPADAQLVEGSYVSVILSGSGMEDALYLNNMFLRTENGRAYVYKRGADGKLVKTYVKTGAILWNTYTAVYSGVTQEDWIAFPYGKEVWDGAETVEGSAEEYYAYGIY